MKTLIAFLLLAGIALAQPLPPREATATEVENRTGTGYVSARRLPLGGGEGTPPSDTAFAASWNGVTAVAPSKNAIYDWAHVFDTDDDGKVNVLDLSLAGLVVVDSSGAITGVKTAPSGDLVGTSDTQTVTNKTIDGDDNTVQDLAIGAIKASTLVIESEGIASNDNDTTLPTSAAVKDYADTAITNERTATATLSGKTIAHAAAPGSDDTFTGDTITGLNNSGGVTQWDAVYLNGSSQWVLADANGTGTYPATGLATATVATGNATTVLVRGVVRNDAWTWTPGGRIYLSTTAGGLTQTAPATSGDKVQDVGFALSADVAWINFDGVFVEVD
jgi:hypothetical protein